MIVRSLGAAIAVMASTLAGAAAQEPARTFEVVSIRRSSPDSSGASVGIQPGGRFVLRNASLVGLLGTAYPTDVSEYPGAPDWVMNERYDLQAVAPPGTTRAEIEPMLRALLAERFDFKGHYESPERPIYHLVLARPARGPSAALKRVDVDCDGRRAASTRGDKVPELPRRPNGAVPCGYNMNGGDSLRISSGGMTMATLARSIQGHTERVVVDRTGLDGAYEFALEFASKPGPNSDHVDVFTALQEQLGLKLESARGPVRVLVIDHIERPTEN